MFVWLCLVRSSSSSFTFFECVWVCVDVCGCVGVWVWVWCVFCGLRVWCVCGCVVCVCVYCVCIVCDYVCRCVCCVCVWQYVTVCDGLWLCVYHCNCLSECVWLYMCGDCDSVWDSVYVITVHPAYLGQGKTDPRGTKFDCQLGVPDRQVLLSMCVWDDFILGWVEGCDSPQTFANQPRRNGILKRQLRKEAKHNGVLHPTGKNSCGMSQWNGWGRQYEKSWPTDGATWERASFRILEQAKRRTGITTLAAVAAERARDREREMSWRCAMLCYVMFVLLKLVHGTNLFVAFERYDRLLLSHHIHNSSRILYLFFFAVAVIRYIKSFPCVVVAPLCEKKQRVDYI